MQWGERPIIMLGNGARGADIARLEGMGVPILTSWAAKDMIDNEHPMYFGSPGQYGQRVANKIFYEADHILSIGNRMSIWNVGYEGPRSDQRLVMVDVDAYEVAKFPQADWINQDAAAFVDDLDAPSHVDVEWIVSCVKWRESVPLVEPGAHEDMDKYVNSYRFMAKLQKFLKQDSIIVTDAGGACCSAWQVLQIKPPQKMMTSGGLGEMGCALPAAIGAAFATDKEIICLVGDGALMLNLQELATISHHKLPVKIIVFANDGYGMIKRTQENAAMQECGSGVASGLSCPDFIRLARSFGIETVLTLKELFRKTTPSRKVAPTLMQVDLHPDQRFVPRVMYSLIDGKQVYDRFDCMSPKLEI